MTLAWTSLRTWNGTQQGAFEELCCQLAECESVPDASLFFRKGTPDAGVECYWKLPGGEERGWQAKFFLSTPEQSQWKQIDDSVETALRTHPALVQYVVCVPINRADPRVERQKWFMDKWNDHVTKWRQRATTSGMNVDFIYWGEHEIFQRLTGDEHRGRMFFWFHQELLTNEWFKNHLAGIIEDAGPRYTPKAHVELPIAWSFEALGRTPRFFGALRQEYSGVLKRSRILSRHRSELLVLTGTSFGNLEAALGALFAQLRNLPEEEAVPMLWVSLSEKVSQCLKVVEECLRAIHDKEVERDCQDKESESTGSRREHSDNLRWRGDELQDLRQALWRLDEFISADESSLCNVPALLLVGDAGVGKTHLFCDIAERRISDALPTIAFLGQHLRDQEPWSQLTTLADLTCTREEFLGALSAAAQARRRRALIFIDALNEGDGKVLWPTTLPSFLEAVRRHPWIGIALSVRTSYERIIVQQGLVPEKLTRLQHPGFAGHEYEAAQHFFQYYSISLARVPLLVPEYQNPLFLKILCEALQKRHLSAIPLGIRGVSAVFEFFVDASQEKLEERPRFPSAAGW